MLPADESACGLYRMRFPAGAVGLVRPDWQIEVYRPTDVRLGTGMDGRLWSVQGIPEPDKIDCVIMQRVATQAQVGLISWFQSKGTAVVIDSDDAMWVIDKDNVAWKAWNTPTHHWRSLDQAAHLADLTTVTTPVLARRYGKHGRCEVLPNCIPADLMDLLEPLSRDDTRPVVGWAGFTSTHPGDLTVVGDAVARLGEEVTVRVVGDAEGAARDWGIQGVEQVGPVKLGLPYYSALTLLDIGLVPLRTTAFNRAKSWLKALEYAATGVAVVASDTPENRRLSSTVPMLLDEWYDSLRLLIDEPDHRAQRVALAREAVFKNHTYEVNAERWALAWERAMNRRARMSA